MKLYYMKGACSLASYISLNEAGIKFEAVEINHQTHKTRGGEDLNAINSKDYVPVLRLDNGEILTENVAVLQYIADRNPGAKLAPAAGTMERYHLMEWLSFINSEVHKNFSPLFRQDAPEDTKQYVRKMLGQRVGYIERTLGDKSYLTGEQFTVADAYLFTVLSWGTRVDVDIDQWPKIKRYVERVSKRPHVIEALKAEGLLK